MSTFFPCHSVIAGDRAARIWIRKAAFSPLDAATPGRVRHSFDVTPSGLPTTVTRRPLSSKRFATRLASARVTASIKPERRSI